MQSPAGSRKVFLLLVVVCTAAGIHARTPRALLDSSSSDSVATIYKDGLQSGWGSWSWGTKTLNLQDSGNVMSGSKYALCATLAPYGAVSLKSNIPFTLDGILGLYIHSTGGATTSSNTSFSLGDLELQFESSAPSSYTISRSYTLSELLNRQGWIDGKSPDTMLHNIESNGWESLKVQMGGFAPSGTDSAKYDRITLGSCLQRFDLCTGKTVPDIYLCLDKLVMVSGG
ncbi:hypothetical protein APUTEX25_002276 [Auxenochlorella protothecoides]|nr:hypothetical protein APUTEX25_002276 [Auxenochlorella protothecoides]|eukprot:RMZ57044.1 hypothetical protein APUTEX25_002276 [Auxenochlorella protothecoides]